VPAQEGLRCDEQAELAPGRQQAARRREQRAVTWSESRPLNLTAEDIELMAQHDQLDVLHVRGAATPSQQLQEGDKGEVDEGEEHRAMLSEPARHRPSAQIRVLAPFTTDRARTAGSRPVIARGIRSPGASGVIERFYESLKLAISKRTVCTGRTSVMMVARDLWERPSGLDFGASLCSSGPDGDTCVLDNSSP